ncbi:MAG: AAA family ATPase [Bacteroidota bacterium]
MKLAISDLHQDLFDFLLAHNRERRKPLAYLFRDPSDSKLEQGWWFPGNDNWVNLFFTESRGVSTSQHKDNLEVSIHKSGTISLDAWFSKDQSTSWLEFLKGSFHSIGTLQQGTTDGHFQITPEQPYYRQSLPKILEALSDLIHSSEFEQVSWLKPIPPTSFKTSLVAIQAKQKQATDQNQRITLQNVQIDSYHALKGIHLPDIPQLAPWIFLTGNNGAGKTLVLQAIAMGLLGHHIQGVPSQKGISLAYAVSNPQTSKTFFNELAYPDFLHPLAQVCGYGPQRLTLQSEASENQESKSSSPIYSLFFQDGLLKNIETELKFAYYEDTNKFASLEQLLTQVIPGLDHISFDKKHRILLYHEKNPETGELFAEPVSLNKLASGIRSIIGLVGDMYVRLSANKSSASPDGEYTKPNELKGIVLIDELDLHLHPSWQKQLPTLLSQVFPKVQFIASTHSPISLLGAPENSIFWKVERRDAGHAIVQVMETEVQNLTPNLILSSEMFGFQALIPTANRSLESLRTEEDMEEVEFQDEVATRLRRFAEQGGEFPKDMFTK